MANKYQERRLRVKQDAAEFLPEHLQRFTPHANWVQNRIIRLGAMGMVRGREPEFTRLKRDYIAKEIGKTAATALLRYLRQEGFIERTRNYYVGSESYGYRIGPRLAGLPTRELLLTDRHLLARLAREDHRRTKRWTTAHRHLRVWLKEVKLDMAGGTKVLAELRPEIRESVLEVMTAISQGDMHPSVCNFGRFHSAITHLKREIRPLLSIHGQPLVNIDVANSQPLFLAISLFSSSSSIHPPSSRPARAQLSSPTQDTRNTTHTYESDNRGGRLPPHPPAGEPTVPLTPSRRGGGTAPTQAGTIRRRSIGKKQRKCLQNKLFTAKESVPYSDDLKTQEFPEDVEHYFDLCQRGQLYNFLMDGTEWYGGKTAWKDQVWFRFLYGSPVTKKHRRNPDLAALVRLAEFFKKTFPSVDRAIREKKRPNYRELAREMQRRESDLMIGHVVGRLAAEYPDVPVVTIHDSVMTTSEHVPLIRQLIEEAFAELRVKPTLRIEGDDAPAMAA